MDYTDYKIIDILQKDGRISMKNLGKLVSLSPPAVAERVRRLEEEGIIEKYKAIINTEKIGKPIRTLINASIKPEKQDKFIEYANNSKDITECHHVTGPYSMIIKANLGSITNLEELVGKIQTFGNTETYIIMSSPIEGKSI